MSRYTENGSGTRLSGSFSTQSRNVLHAHHDLSLGYEHVRHFFQHLFLREIHVVGLLELEVFGSKLMFFTWFQRVKANSISGTFSGVFCNAISSISFSLEKIF